jgi:hypothetical protein
MRPLSSDGKPGLSSRVLVALAALISLGALLRPLVWSGASAASAAERAVHPVRNDARDAEPARDDGGSAPAEDDARPEGARTKKVLQPEHETSHHEEVRTEAPRLQHHSPSD